MVRRVWLSDCLLLVCRRMSLRTKVFSNTLNDMRSGLQLVTKESSLATLSVVLYTGRHSGASIDRSNGTDLLSVQRRGRWRTLASVRRYEKAGLLQRALGKVSPSDLKVAERAAERLPVELLAACSRD